MFAKGDKILHPMHGAGVVKEIVTRQLDGKSVEYYEIQLVSASMGISFPVRSCGEVGVRPVLAEDVLMGLLENGQTNPVEDELSWNKRYRENMLKIRTGDFLQVFGVVKNLEFRRQNHPLSNGEKKMFDSARHILVSEMASVLDEDYDAATKRLGAYLVVNP